MLNLTLAFLSLVNNILTCIVCRKGIRIGFRDLVLPRPQIKLVYSSTSGEIEESKAQARVMLRLPPFFRE
jgi:hypothetical protein